MQAQTVPDSMQAQTVPGSKPTSLTEFGLQRWLTVQEVTGRQEARPGRRWCSEFNHLGHVGRSMVGVNEVHQEA